MARGWPHGYGFPGLKRKGLERRFAVTVVPAQFDLPTDFRTCSHKLIRRTAIVDQWKEYLSIGILRGQGPTVSDGDIA